MSLKARILYGLFILALFGLPLYASDWSNPNPQSVSDKAGPLLLKHEDNFTDLYSGSSAKLNQLKASFAGSGSPSSPSNGQPWYDTTNKYFKLYDSVCGGWGCGGFYSSGTNSLYNLTTLGTHTIGTASITTATIGTATIGTASITGVITASGGLASLSTTTLSGGGSITGTYTGIPTFQDGIVSSGTITANTTGLAMVGELSSSGSDTVLELDMGSVTAGDRIFIMGYRQYSDTGTGHAVHSIEKSSGTATVQFFNAAAGIFDTIYVQSAAVSYHNSIAGVCKVTGSGTLVLKDALAVASSADGMSVSLYGFFLKKQ